LFSDFIRGATVIAGVIVNRRAGLPFSACIQTAEANQLT